MERKVALSEWPRIFDLGQEWLIRMAKLIGKFFGALVQLMLLPFVIVFAIPMGVMKARRAQAARLLFTGDEQSILAKAQQTMNMDSHGLLSPDGDLLEAAKCIEECRVNYQTIKSRERYDETFSEYLMPRLGKCHIHDWDKVIVFFHLSATEMGWEFDLSNWLNRVTTFETMYVEGCETRYVKGDFKPSTIAEVQCLVLGSHSWGSGVTELPESLFQLRALRELHLQRNGISQLSESVGQLENLEELKLGGNYLLRALPASIGKLKKLRVLTLWWCDLVALPAEIGELTELVGLDISDSKSLTTLPPEITKLRKLKRLYLPDYSAGGKLRLTSEQKEWIDSLPLEWDHFGPA